VPALKCGRVPCLAACLHRANPAPAVKGENFREAAAIKARLEALNARDPVLAAKRDLDAAVKAENYAVSSRARSSAALARWLSSAP
jgi:hypothetical protein